MVLFDNGVALSFEVVNDGLFGLAANGGGVFARFGSWGREAGKRFAGLEGFAVFRCKAILIDGLNVSFSAIADMLVESILWVFGGEVNHVFVTSDFGDDGGSGDGFDLGVGFDKSGDVRRK